ncbi:MAG: hypothetical protein BWY68_00162 [bacterium ADurb.Bin400]|nr:MAG: hypothetical protein BWY68_00162 [bacterium ADurb.Bin400]
MPRIFAKIRIRPIRSLKHQPHLVALVVIMLIAFAGNITTLLPQKDIRFTIDQVVITKASDKHSLSFNYTLAPENRRNGKIIVVPLAKQPTKRQVALYQDASYHTVFTSPITHSNFVALASEYLKSHDVDDNAEIVDANGLKEKIARENADGTAEQSVIIMASGGIPDILYSDEHGWKMLDQWVINGGVLIWIGATPGEYALTPKTQEHTRYLGRSGTTTLGLSGYYFPYDLPPSTQRLVGNSPSLYGSAFNTMHRNIYRSPMAKLMENPTPRSSAHQDTQKQTDFYAMVLGRVSNPATPDYSRTSISMVKHNKGRYIIFSSELLDNAARTISLDIAKILKSEVIDITHPSNLNIIKLNNSQSTGDWSVNNLQLPNQTAAIAIIYVENQITNSHLIKHIIPVN